MNEQLKEQGRATEEKILAAVISYIEQHGYSPTYREIGEMVGLKSTYTVRHHIQRLLARGELETDAAISTPRAIRVPSYHFVRRES